MPEFRTGILRTLQRHCLEVHGSPEGKGEMLVSVPVQSTGSQTGYKGRRGLPPLSRKRSKPLPAPAGRNMRQRCATWNATAAAAHTLARLQLADDS